MRVYIAGPDIFRPDASIWAETVRALLARHGQQALIPIDGDELTASGIYHANLEMIRSADVVLANLNAFRGHEPDSGTCFEVGFATAQGKPVIGYLSDGRVQKDKVSDADGLRVENFGLPLNLMLALACRIVIGDLGTAVAELSTLAFPSGRASSPLPMCLLIAPANSHPYTEARDSGNTRSPGAGQS
ncbi:nucleoside 2-deoxyribosyltransferase [Propionivibrio sp.]|uniref:nucleoside 2-deoxyribosyltransferase n=1 Tax=Propionivibrio sp. TaxID=2212460 RepID=UPI0026047B01|nr:nucleoside 2-deoxyribosyltransferase [Propionivibrio sp.]